MSPADVLVVWPTGAEILRAVTVAAEIEGCDPIDLLHGLAGAKGRAYAAIALAHQYPTAPRRPLARKLGNELALTGARRALVEGIWPWFELDRLNDVRAALDWPAMTMEDAKAATLLYCGRSWEEFLPRTVDLAVTNVVAGSGAEAGEPAGIQSSDGGVERHARSAAYVGACGVGTRLAPSTGTVPELEAERAEIGNTRHPSPRPNRPVSGKARALRAEGQSHAAGMTPRPPAGMLAGSPGPPDPAPLTGGAQSPVLDAETPASPNETGDFAAAPNSARAPEEKAAVASPRILPAIIEIEDNDLPSAPPQRELPPGITPSPAAPALADAVRSMRRRPQRVEAAGLTAAFCGDPTPEQRRRMAETPGNGHRNAKDWNRV